MGCTKKILSFVFPFARSVQILELFENTDGTRLEPSLIIRHPQEDAPLRECLQVIL